MTIMRNLDTDNDWTFGKGLSNYVSKNDAIALDIKTGLLEWMGECFFALLDGIDWYNRLDFNQKNNLDNDIKKFILCRNGVVGIVNFSSNLVDRRYTATYTIQTIYTSSFTDTIDSGDINYG